MNNKFELDKRNSIFGFQCSICLNRDSDVYGCQVCPAYHVTMAQEYDIKMAIESLINNLKRNK